MDEIFDNAIDWNINTMKITNIRIGLYGYFTSLLANLSIGKKGR